MPPKDDLDLNEIILNLFSLSPSATAVFDHKHGRCLISNRAFNTQLGYTSAQLNSGKIVFSHLFSSPHEANDIIALITDRNVVRRAELTLIDNEGREFPALASGRMLNQPYDQLFEFSFVEISKQVQLQQALSREHARMTSLIDNLAAGLFLVNTADQISEANLALANLLEVNQAEIIGKESSYLVNLLLSLATEPDLLQQKLQSTILKAAETPVVEFVLQRREQRFHYELILFPVRDDQGLPIGWGGLLQDITALRDQSIWKLNLLAMLAQEIRSPLATIKGHTTALLANYQSWSPSMVEEFLGALDHSTDDLIHKVDRNLALTRVETGRLGLRPEAISPQKLIDQALERTADLLEDVPVERRIPEGLPEVRVDPARIEEVLINLIENAVQHAPSEKGFLISAEERKTHVYFHIEDYGPGIPSGDQQGLFIPPKQDETSPSPRGLGLYIAAKIVEAHGGAITLTSPIEKRKKGSRFSFSVPIMVEVKKTGESETPRPGAKVKPETAKIEKPHRILAVDNQPDFQALYQTIIPRNKYDLEISQDGQTALEIIQVAPPDLILLDTLLPDIDGISICRQVRRWTDVPIIMVSSRNAQEDVVTALDAGADDYLIKPFVGDELLARIRAVLRRGDPIPREKGSNRFAQMGLVIDYDTREVWKSGQKVYLTATEFDLLAYFSRNPRQTLKYHQIIETVWGSGTDSTRHALSVHISRLRKKIEPDADNPSFIVTRWGVGYVFLPDH